MFGALKRGFRSMASLILVRNVVGKLQPKRTLAASRGFLAAARLSCFNKVLMYVLYVYMYVTDDVAWHPKVLWGSTVGYPSDSLASCPAGNRCHFKINISGTYWTPLVLRICNEWIITYSYMHWVGHSVCSRATNSDYQRLHHDLTGACAQCIG